MLSGIATAYDSALDNEKQYDSSTETISIWDKGQIGDDTKLVEAKLNTPKNNLVIRGKDRLVWEYELETYWQDYDTLEKMVSNVKVYDKNNGMKEVDKPIAFRMKQVSYQNITDYKETCTFDGLNKSTCTTKETGSHLIEIVSWLPLEKAEKLDKRITIGAFTDVEIGESMEWTFDLLGHTTTEWAAWTDSLTVAMIAYWNGNGTTDSYTGTYNLTKTPTLSEPVYTETPTDGAVFGKSMELNASGTSGSTGRSDYINNTPCLTSNCTNSTFNFWVIPHNVGNYFTVFSSANSENVKNQFRVGGDNMDFYSGGENTVAGGFVAKRKYMITETINQTTVTYYVNGTRVTEFAYVPTGNIRPVFFGASYDNAYGYNGTLDEIAVWNRTLSASEISSLYDGGTGTFFTGTTVTNNFLNVSTTLVSPANNSNYITNLSLIFNATSTTVNGNISNMTIYVWNATDLYNKTTNAVTPATNQTTWNISFYNAPNNYTWNVESCGINATASFCANATANFTLQTVITKPNVTFNFQDVPDIDFVNSFGKLLNISYNISTIYGLNVTSLTFKTNSSTKDYSILVNGSVWYTGWQNSLNATTTLMNSSSGIVYNWKLPDNALYPATYNINETLMENTTHSVGTLVGGTDLVKVQLLNVSNSSQYNLFEIMSNVSVGTGSASFYYCNSSYATGNPAANVNCALFGTLASTTPYNHTHTVNSKHMLLPFFINMSSGSFGAVRISPTSYFVEGIASGQWNYYYIPNIARIDAIQTSTNTGGAWTNLSGTVDSHLHQFNGNDTLWYYACAQNILGRINCSDIREDLMNISGLPPTAPQVYSPNKSAFIDFLTINYTAALSPNEYTIIFYNISLLYENETINSTIQSNNSQNLSFVWNQAYQYPGVWRIKVVATDNMSQTSTGVSAPFVIYDTAKTFNKVTYEMFQENYIINVSFGSTWVNATANISYGGTVSNTSRSGTGFLFSQTVPASGQAVKSIFWNVYLSNATDSITLTTNTSVQNINETLFAVCNASNNVPFLNITFKNETIAQQPVTAGITSTWVYYVSNSTVNKSLSFSNTTENYGYSFCLSPPSATIFVNPAIQYYNSYSQTRNFNPGIVGLTNATTNITLYLLPTTLGQFVTFQVINTAQQVIAGALVNVTNAFGGTESKLTDDAGSATVFMNPTTSYTVVVSKTGYITQTITITPTQTQYTVVLTAIESTNFTDFSKGITTKTEPRDSQLVNNTNYIFNFTINSTFWELDQYGFSIGNLTDIYVSVSDTASLGGTVSTTLNTGKNTTILMRYYWIINGTTINATRQWFIWDDSNTQYSINNFANDLKRYINSSSFFGLETNGKPTNFGLTMIIFLIILVFTGIMSYKFGITSPAAISFIVFACVLFFDVGLGIIANPIGAIEHFPTIFVAVIMIGLFFKEVSSY